MMALAESRKKSRILRAFLALLTAFVTLTASEAPKVRAAEEKHRIVENLAFSVDGNSDHVVKALHYKYE